MKRVTLLVSVLILTWMTWLTCRAEPALAVWVIGCVLYALGVGALWGERPDPRPVSDQQGQAATK